MIRRIRYETALEQTQQLFLNAKNDQITPHEAYEAGDKMGDSADKRKTWLRDRLTDLRYYGLVESVYMVEGGQRVLSGIKLTQRGKTAIESFQLQQKNIQQASPMVVIDTHQNAFTLSDVIGTISTLKRDYPNEAITIDFKIAEGIVSVHMAH